MSESEERTIYDAMRAIQDNAVVMGAVVMAEGSQRAREAYSRGVSLPILLLGGMLTDDAIERGKARHARVAELETRSLPPEPDPSRVIKLTNESANQSKNP